MADKRTQIAYIVPDVTIAQKEVGNNKPRFKAPVDKFSYCLTLFRLGTECPE